MYVYIYRHIYLYTIPIRRMEFNGVNGSPAESIHVHRNYWSCDKPNLRQVRYKPDMPRS